MNFTTTMLRRAAALLAVSALAACGGGDDESVAPAASDSTVNAAIGSALSDAAPSAKASRKDAKDGKVHLIVKFRDDVDDPDGRGRDLAAAHGAEHRFSYAHAIKGFAVSLPQAAAPAFLAAMARNPQVDLVEEDGETQGDDVMQANATWGLDRIDQRTLPLTGSYVYGRNGAGVRVYIVDSGVRASHSEVAGRVLGGYDVVGDGYGTNDCNGHGTHVAATVGGRTWGVAKAVKFVPIRVLGCQNSGSVSGLIAGIDWMVANAQRPAVANLSIGAGASSTLDAAVERAVAAGINMVVAAGNSGDNACNYSPARTPGAITVGAIGSADARAAYSNYGSCVDIFAPGSSITSAGIASDTATAVMSGTSMATPHVVGAVALSLQLDPIATPAQVATGVKANATTNSVFDAGAGSPNKVLFTRYGSILATAPPTPVTSTEISVNSLGGAGVNSLLYWYATATVGVTNSSGALVPGAVVTGTFSPGGTALSCTTASNGACTIASGWQDMGTVQTQFTVTNLAASATTYNAARNRVTSVTIARP